MPPNLQTAIYIEDQAYWHVIARQSLDALSTAVELRGARTGAEGLALCKSWSPDLVLLDLSLPDMDGFEMVRKVAELPSPPRVLVITIRLDEASLHRIGQSSVVGMIWKNSRDPLRELRVAASTVLSGGSYFAADVRDAMRKMRQTPDAFQKILSPGEIALLPLFGLGLTDKEISGVNGTEESGVHSKRKRIMAKLDLHSKQELMVWCAQRGFSDLARPDSDSALPR